MKFSKDKIMQAVEFANKIKNPNEAISMLLTKMSKNNPDTAKKISTMIKSGENPINAIQKFASDGSFSIEELNKIKKFYAIGKKFGLKNFDVSDNDWKKVENAIKTSKKSTISKPNNNGILGGF